MNKYLYDLFDICLNAGKEIMDIYNQDFDVEFKVDDSPLTAADKRAHIAIAKGLENIDPTIPVLSEEVRQIPYAERKDWEQYWLVDPLDGTKEFIKKNGEFTVNIALIKGSYPELGVIYAPALDTFYFGVNGKGAYKLNHASKVTITSTEDLVKQSVRLPEVDETKTTHVVASRSHMSKETKDFIHTLDGGEVKVISTGSSLKFCLVAEGKADYYPRYAPTMEWDTGAGQAS